MVGARINVSGLILTVVVGVVGARINVSGLILTVVVQ